VTDLPQQESRLSPDPIAPIPPEALPTGEPPRKPGWGRRLRRVHLDTRPLRTSRDFRLLWSAGLVSFLGSMITYVAVPFQIYDLTGSTLAVGLLGVAELVPLVFFGLWGGALADAVDRRKMVLFTEVALTVLSALLMVNALLPHPHVWPIFVVAALVAACDGLQRPSLEALIPRIVAHDQLPAASALGSLRMNIGSIAGPALGGVLVAAFGTAAAYGVDVMSFLASLVALSLIRAVPPPSGAEKPSLRGIAEGLRYATSRQELLGTYVIDIAAMLFAMPIALFPAMAKDVFDAPWALGLLFSAGSVGSLIATVTSGWTTHVHHHGRAVAYAAVAWGVSILAFGLAGNVWLAVFFLMLAGAADMVSGLFRSTIWNQTIPDELRGRLAGIELLSYSTGPLLGNARAGGVAAVWSVRGSVVSGGIACVLSVGALAAILPKFMRYDARTNEHAVRERDRRERESTASME
jgi:MFS family permease